MSRPAVGRGLNALFNFQPSPQGGVREIDIASVQPSPGQPRLDFAAESLAELAASIQANGVIQPLVVRPIGEQYQLVTGERRLRAARQAGLTQVPVVVRHDLSDQDVLFLGLIENLQREDLNPVEEAKSLHRLVEETKLTHDDLARRIGKSRTHITNTLRLLRLPDPVLEWMRAGKLTAGHARALLALDLPEQMVEVARRVLAEGWNVRQVERFVQDYVRQRDQRKTEKPPKLRSALSRELKDRLEKHLAAKVSLRQAGEKGTLKIEYRGADGLRHILARLGLDS